MRFGERGRRFTSSDSCWLLAITGLPAESVTKQLAWLRRILCVRGIPTIILCRRLRHIAEMIESELKPHDLQRARCFEPFLTGIDDEQVSLAERVQDAIQQFDTKLRSCSGLNVPSAADLIACAWLDQQAGFGGAFSATHDWFADSARFSSDWIACVRELTATLDRCLSPIA
jgi:hypothetical protein